MTEIFFTSPSGFPCRDFLSLPPSFFDTDLLLRGLEDRDRLRLEDLELLSLVDLSRLELRRDRLSLDLDRERLEVDGSSFLELLWLLESVPCILSDVESLLSDLRLDDLLFEEDPPNEGEISLLEDDRLSRDLPLSLSLLFLTLSLSLELDLLFTLLCSFSVSGFLFSG